MLNYQINKIKTAVKSQTEVTLKMSIKMFEENNLPHELLLTTRRTTKLRNVNENNMSTDLKLSKIMKVAVPLVRDILTPLGITAVTSAIQDAGIQRKYMVLEQQL